MIHARQLEITYARIKEFLKIWFLKGMKKNLKNFRKHRINFEEAKSVFNDPFALTIPDPKHSIGEYRYIDIGYSSKGRILVVTYSERRSNIRIISCRRATE